MSKREFGTTQAHKKVHEVAISSGGLTVKLLTLGAIINDVRLSDVPYSLTLGSPDLAPYENKMKHFGAIVGPVANRISNAQAPLNGTVLHFEANEGTTTLHSGSVGTHAEIWSLDEAGETYAVFKLELADQQSGFPGKRQITARYEVEAPSSLTMTLTATTDKETLLNLANHSYWNLDGGPDTAGHTLQVDADEYLPTDKRQIPTGVADVSGTAFDFRKMRRVGADQPERIDHTLCLNGGKSTLRQVAELSGSLGVSMRMETTEPGLQVYDAENAATGSEAGHDENRYGKFCGMALEAQGWPDAPNHPSFPSITLGSGETYEQITRWVFQEKTAPSDCA